MTVTDYILIGVGVVVLLLIMVISFVAGLLNGYSVRHARELINELMEESKQTKAIEEQPGSAVIDSSPKHLREKAEERYRKGEDVEDDDESQIITTKTEHQKEMEAEIAKESKLDKWMPNVKKPNAK